MYKTGNWDNAVNELTYIPKRFKKNVEIALYNLAIKAKRVMIDGIRKKKFKLTPNTESTIKSKGSSTPLINDGDLIGSIKVHKTPKGYLVGVNRKAYNSKGDSLLNIFAILTYGVDKVLASGRRMKIPARDAITPTIKEVKKDFKNLFRKALDMSFKIK